MDKTKQCEQCDGVYPVGSTYDKDICKGCDTGITHIINENGQIIGEMPYISKKDRADGVVHGPGAITYYDIPKRF